MKHTLKHACRHIGRILFRHIPIWHTGAPRGDPEQAGGRPPRLASWPAGLRGIGARRVGLAASIVVVLVIAVTAVASWMVPEARIRAAVAERVHALTGLDPVIDGPARLFLLPVPTISVERLALPGRAGVPLVEAERLDATLRLAPLLLGRFEWASLSVVRPRMVQAEAAWPAGRDLLAALLPRASALPGSVRVTEGRIVYRDGQGRAQEIGLDDGGIASAALGGGLQASSVVSWRGQTFDVSVFVADPQALSAGGRSEVRAKVACPLMHVAASGTLGGSQSHFDGTASAAGPSLRAVLRWLDVPLRDGPSLAAFSLQSPAAIDAGGASLPDVQLELDANALQGALAVKPGASRVQVSGTLAGDSLDVTPYASDLAFAADGRAGWRSEPVDLGLLSLADLDLRVSAGEARLSGARFAHVAAALSARDGAAELSLGEASAYGGLLKGRLALRPVPAGAQLSASLSLDAVDAGAALTDLVGAHRFQGTGTVRLDVSSEGRSVDDLMHALRGRADLDVLDGALLGIDLPDTLRRIQRRPLSASLDQWGGRTPFDRLGGDFVIERGIATTRDGHLGGADIQLGLTGDVDLGERRIDLAAQAVLPAGEPGPDYRLPFRVAGAWSRPALSLDTDSLIRQSGAAAALLRGLASASPGEGIAVSAQPQPVPTLTP